jgi:hypothetical protein
VLGSQSTHRVATATFCRTYHHDGQISPAWQGWVVHPLSLSLYLLSRAKLWFRLRRKIRSLLIVLYPFMYSVVWLEHYRRYPMEINKGKPYYNYFCTFDLYSPVHNVLDACIFITRGSGRGLGPGILEIFGPCEMASSQ